MHLRLQGPRRPLERVTQAGASISRKYRSTGLGLAICRKLVEEPGGSIGAAARPGGGGIVRFDLMLGVVEPARPA